MTTMTKLSGLKRMLSFSTLADLYI